MDEAEFIAVTKPSSRRAEFDELNKAQHSKVFLKHEKVVKKASPNSQKAP